MEQAEPRPARGQDKVSAGASSPSCRGTWDIREEQQAAATPTTLHARGALHQAPGTQVPGGPAGQENSALG